MSRERKRTQYVVFEKSQNHNILCPWRREQDLNRQLGQMTTVIMLKIRQIYRENRAFSMTRFCPILRSTCSHFAQIYQCDLY